MMSMQVFLVLMLSALAVCGHLTSGSPVSSNDADQSTDGLNTDQIFIKTESGETIRVTISLNGTVETLEDSIMLLDSVPPAHQTLTFNGELLDDNKKLLSDYKLVAGSEVTLVAHANDEDEEEAIWIDVKTLVGKSLAIRIHPIRYVSSLKDKITKLTGIAKEDQRLVLNGKQLKDNVRLAKYNICDGITLRLAPPLNTCRGVHEIRVKVLSGATATIEIDLADTVMRLKQKVANEMGVAPSLQRLVFEYRQLDDEDHLCDFGIQAHSVVNIVLYAPSVKGPAGVPNKSTATTSVAPFRGPIFKEADEDVDEDGATTRASRPLSATEDARNWIFQDQLPYYISNMFDPLAYLKLDSLYEIWYQKAADEMRANGTPGKLDLDTYKLLCALNKMSTVVTHSQYTGARVVDKPGVQLGATWTPQEHLGANINNYAPNAFQDSEIVRLFERADRVREQLAHDSSTGEGNLGLAKQRKINLELLYAVKEALAGVPLAEENDSQTGDCAICCESFGSESPLGLPCKHLYHVDCLLQWSGEQHRYQHKSLSCPQCRQACRLPYGLSKIDDFN